MNETHIKTLISLLNHWKHLNAERICEEKEGRETIEALQAAIEALQMEPCDDAISRQAVLAMMQMRMGAKELYRAVYDLPSVTPQQGWIPVSERLPEENICDDGYHEPSELILAYMKSGEMHVARYWSRYDYRWLGIITPTTDEVVAWMPLPLPWKAESEG